MSKYEIIVYWSDDDDDDAFIAEVPELPGCAADGATYREAIGNVEVIIEEWLETAKQWGRPIPIAKVGNRQCLFPTKFAPCVEQAVPVRETLPICALTEEIVR